MSILDRVQEVAFPTLLCALLAAVSVAVVLGEPSVALPVTLFVLVAVPPLLLLLRRRDAGRLAVTGVVLVVLGAAAAPAFAYLVDTEVWNVGGFLGSIAVIAVGVGFLLMAWIWHVADRP